MNKNVIGMRTDSVFEAENFDPFTGLDRIKRRLAKIEKALGIKDELDTYVGNQAALDAGLKPGDRYKTGTGSYMIVHA